METLNVFTSLIWKVRLEVMNALQKIYAIIHSPGPTYCIEEIDSHESKVIVRCRGTRTMIKTTIAEITCDSTIIDGLSPIQACLIGGYFGRALRTSLEKNVALKKVTSMTFLLKNNYGQYKIIFQNRDENIGYLDIKNKREYLEHPIAMVRSRFIIARFDSSQACYLGILAGISMEKAISLDGKTGKNNFEKLLHQSPILRIVE